MPHDDSLERRVLVQYQIGSQGTLPRIWGAHQGSSEGVGEIRLVLMEFVDGFMEAFVRVWKGDQLVGQSGFDIFWNLVYFHCIVYI